MKWEEQYRLFKEMTKDLNDLLVNKGREYAGDHDCLDNFKSGADIGVNPKQKLIIFAEKHYSSIKSYVKHGKVFSNEPIEGRIHDMINYMFLLLCLIKEEQDVAGRGKSEAVSEKVSRASLEKKKRAGKETAHKKQRKPVTVPT